MAIIKQLKFALSSDYIMIFSIVIIFIILSLFAKHNICTKMTNEIHTKLINTMN